MDLSAFLPAAGNEQEQEMPIFVAPPEVAPMEPAPLVVEPEAIAVPNSYFSVDECRVLKEDATTLTVEITIGVTPKYDGRPSEFNAPFVRVTRTVCIDKASLQRSAEAKLASTPMAFVEAKKSTAQRMRELAGIPHSKNRV